MSMFSQMMVDSNRTLYTPPAFARTNLLYLQEVGTITALRPHTSERNGLDSYLFFVVVSGSGTLSYDNIDYQLQRGDAAFIDCHTKYAHRSAVDLWQLKWIHFNGSSLKNIYAKYVRNGGKPCFQCQNPYHYIKLIDETQEIASSDSRVRDIKICSQITTLLANIMEEAWADTPDKKAAVSRKHKLIPVRDYLDQHFQEPISLETVAEKFFFNKYYLARSFKSEYDITIGNYVARQRINHAKHLLRFSDDSIEKIGRKCGLSDSNYFARFFHKMEGVSPSEFRRLWRR